MLATITEMPGTNHRGIDPTYMQERIPTPVWLPGRCFFQLHTL